MIESGELVSEAISHYQMKFLILMRLRNKSLGLGCPAYVLGIRIDPKHGFKAQSIIAHFDPYGEENGNSFVKVEGDALNGRKIALMLKGVEYGPREIASI